MRRTGLWLLLFGVGSLNITNSQRAARALHGKKNLQEAFPHLAAMWIQGDMRNHLVNPHNLECLSSKKMWWQCSGCSKPFTMTVARLVDIQGKCPHCSQIPSATKKLSKKVKVLEAQKSNYQRAVDVYPQLKTKNTDPQLARDWNDCVSRTALAGEPLMISPKLDGMRCIVAYDKPTDSVLYISRKGSLFESCDSLDAPFKKLFAEDPDLMLDGEVYTAVVTFEELSSLMRTTYKGRSPEMIERQKDLQYHAFDIMYSRHIPNPAKLTFSSRLELLKTIIPATSTMAASRLRHRDPGFIPIMHVPASPVTIDEVSKVQNASESLGFEGVMIRKANAAYQFGKRNDALMKLKSFQTDEFEILGVQEGTGRLTGSCGSFVCETKGGKRFFATPKALGNTRKELLEKKDLLVGKWITVQFQGVSGDGVPRFPVALAVRGCADGSDWF